MNAPVVSKTSPLTEIDATQAQDVGGGGCSPGDMLQLSQSLTEAYENLVDFTSHVIERVAG